ncbi:D-alanyl-D-alanine carboxypeptidase/D-alanyl-D-alanine endopeptidase [Alicyclobacillus mengziensis]|uniref:D-alanyl-D-alanine carboxypeptidase/D-alanyl-D-alanine-endopeptidase n=1 Tax=Alicyclobacillus mengziensis TaxID=2931921 RepID=A0A9X7VYX6_9BACL|nr:D-alanyl-D-alanine carboxypeptidase/D-alanyl-D-alanine-endopeptidase [Alicyclobacillus mengziensis]QSO47392.1 D-alanyl-D-alanine carboxypeptidase/D-alanyl-D-alanine-endopeptidase [Alicyclobacillus mengziensis]
MRRVRQRQRTASARTPKALGAAVAATLILGTTGTITAYAAVPPPPGPSTPQTPPGGAMSTPNTGLQQAWSSIVSSSPTLKNATISAYAYDITTGKMLAAVNPNMRQTPASVTKLVTSAAALAALGPNYQYTTKVNVEANSTSSAPAPIYLVGGGDPWLEANGATGLETLAQSVASQIKTATQVVGVGSLFTPPTYETGWPIGDIPYNYASGVSALMAERSEIQVKVTATTTGQAPTVKLVFNSTAVSPEYFHIVNQATTLPTGQPSTLSVTRQIGTNNIVIDGGIPAGQTSAPFLSIGHPALFTATLFQDLLKQDGVTFTSNPTTGTLPNGTQTIATHQSQTLAKLLVIQNQYSINQMADNLYRMLGVNATGVGSPQAASAALSKFLQQAGVSQSGLQIVDGSGLSPLDEISSMQLVKLLAYASTQPWFNVLKDSLMHVNHPNNAGILAYHPFNLPTGTNIWVKTGNLSNQWNYAGYAQAENGDLIAFAILDDGAPTYLNSGVGSPLDLMIDDTASWPNVSTTSSSPVSVAPTSLPSAITPPLTQPLTLPLTPQLAQQLAPVLQRIQQAQNSGAVVGVSVVNAATGQPVYDVNGNKLMRAGLLPRLAVGAAALQSGAQFKGVTLEAEGTMSGSTLSGSLVVNGNGDPSLTTGDLAQLATAVKQAGIRYVTGGLTYVDTTNGQYWPDAAPWNNQGQVWAPPASTLSVNHDVVTLTVQAKGPAQTPSVTVSPADAPIQVVNQLTIGTPGPGARPAAGPDGGIQATLKNGTNTYVLTGNVQPGRPVTIQVAPPNAAAVAATALQDALKSAGVAVSGGIQSVAQDPGAKVIATIAAPPVTSLIPALLKDTTSGPATELYNLLGTGGDAAVTQLLGSTDQIVDPTALALENYVTPASVTSMLSSAYNNAADAPLKQALNHLWTFQSPQVQGTAGYVKGPDGTVYAVTVIQAELPWNGSFAPIIQP